jgi:hypothetical protein
MRITTRDKEFTVRCMQNGERGEGFMAAACKRSGRVGVVPALLKFLWQYLEPQCVGISVASWSLFAQA